MTLDDLILDLISIRQANPETGKQQVGVEGSPDDGFMIVIGDTNRYVVQSKHRQG